MATAREALDPIVTALKNGEDVQDALKRHLGTSRVEEVGRVKLGAGSEGLSEEEIQEVYAQLQDAGIEVEMDALRAGLEEARRTGSFVMRLDKPNKVRGD